LKCQWWVAHATTTDLSRPVCRCAVLLEYEIVTRYFLDAWQQLLLQQYFTIIVAIHFHSCLHNFIFQQDSAPAHRARDTIALLHREMPDFNSPDQWPPNSPDMYPVDYKIWAVMQQQVYEKRVNDIEELCYCLLSVWHSIGQNVIDETIGQWRARLTSCVYEQKAVILSTWCKIDLN